MRCMSLSGLRCSLPPTVETPNDQNSEKGKEKSFILLRMRNAGTLSKKIGLTFLMAMLRLIRLPSGKWTRLFSSFWF